MAKLFNPTSVLLITQYAGVSFAFPPGKVVTIKSVRMGRQMLNPDEIAHKCHGDLANRGLVLVNEDDPATVDEMRQEGMEMLEAFIRLQNRNFNEEQAQRASEGRIKLLVPSDLKDLNKILREKILAGKKDAQTNETELISDETIRSIQAGSVEALTKTLARVATAIQAGNIKKAQAILGGATDDEVGSVAADEDAETDTTPTWSDSGETVNDAVGAVLAETTDETPEDSEAMETGIVTPVPNPGNAPGRPRKKWRL